MVITAYLVLVPGADRPYISQHAPEGLERRPGTRVFELKIDVPTQVPVEGVLTPRVTDLTPTFF